MRTTNINGIEISYPNEISFCFNPEIIRLSGSSNTTVVEVWYGDRVYSISIEPYNNIASLNISDITRLFFNSANLFGEATGKKIDIYLRQNGEVLFSFSTFCMWGSISVGERFNGSRVVTWFRAFPFTVSFYTSAGGSIYKKEDDNGYTGFNGNTPQIVYQIDPFTLFNPRKFGMILIEGDEASGTFDDTFDYTFDGAAETEIEIKLIPDDCKDGIYLRWIDKHGFIQYYLFKSGERTNNTANAGETMPIDYQAEDRRFEGVSRQQGKDAIISQKIYVSLVTQSEFDFLEGAYMSPVIDWYVGKDDIGKDVWCPVNVQVGSLARENRSLQDFIMVINYPSLITQKL
jgi:hypothetical protein